MKSLFYILILSGFVFLTSCKKEQSDLGTDPTKTSSVTGKWKYDSNIGVGCNDLFGTLWEVKDGVAIATSVPTNNGYGWKAGDQFLSKITQTTSPNNYTAIGLAKSAGGVIQANNIKVDLAVSTDAKSMTVTLAGVCNPVQLWTKTN